MRASMQTLGAAVLAASLVVSGAFAATDTSAPLAAGKPAGVKQAQLHGHLALWLGIVTVAGVGLGFLASSTGSGTPANSTNATNP